MLPDGSLDSPQRQKYRFIAMVERWIGCRRTTCIGEEALAPPTTQNAFALFTLQTLNFEHAALQFGGRLEHNGYNPTGLEQRSFNGFSGAAGFRVPLGERFQTLHYWIRTLAWLPVKRATTGLGRFTQPDQPGLAWRTGFSRMRRINADYLRQSVASA
jgi:hypothetical protein